MPSSETKIRVRARGRGARLEIHSNGRWYSVALDNPRQKINTPKPKILEERKTIQKEVARLKAPNTQTGMSGGDKTSISLKFRTTYLIGDAVAKRDFELPMGINGQEKILIVKDYAVGAEPRVYLKTQQNASTMYTATKKGQVLHLISDGTYWYLLSTGYATSGSNDAGEWTTN